MRLLVITQKVDKNDPILGFFHQWIIKLAKKFENVSVVCLEKGDYDLPENVQVFSLGKENINNRISHLASRIKYILNFYKYLWRLKGSYDAVFVHMNQEYVLLGGLMWKVTGKKVFLWRNHPQGNILTRIAVWLAKEVFYTSPDAFIVRFKKASRMPVGIDTQKFKIEGEKFESEYRKRKFLFLSRMAPIKKPDILIEALGLLDKRSQDFECDFYGDPLPKDRAFYESLKNKVRGLGLEKKVRFYPAIPNYETPDIYRRHGIFVNLSPSGSFDKTILEAAVCGCLLVIANTSLKGEINEKMIVDSLAPSEVVERLDFWLNTDEATGANTSSELQKYVLENHSLDTLIEKLCTAIKK